jgi:ribosomal protein S19
MSRSRWKTIIQPCSLVRTALKKEYSNINLRRSKRKLFNVYSRTFQITRDCVYLSFRMPTFKKRTRTLTIKEHNIGFKFGEYYFPKSTRLFKDKKKKKI